MDNNNDEFEEHLAETEYLDDGIEMPEEGISIEEENDNYNAEEVSTDPKKIRQATMDENGNISYKKAPKKTRQATMDENGNYTKKRNSILPPKKPRYATMDENGNMSYKKVPTNQSK